MRFLIELVQGEKGDKNTYLGPIHGPYHDDEAVKEAIARLSRLSPKDKVARFLVIKGQILEVRPEPERREARVLGEDVQPIFEDGIRWRLAEGLSWWKRWL